jgi:Protein of unknown function (DUF2637)
MTGTLSLVPAQGRTPAELRAAARDHYLEALEDGTPPSGAELGRRFGRSDRWGRDRVTEAQAAHAASAPASGAPTPPSADLSAVMPGGTTGPVPATAGPSGLAACVLGGTIATGPANPELAGHADDLPAGSRRVRAAIRWVTTVAVIVVAACAARASYDHQRTVVAMAGEADAAWYLPLSVDGMMLVASLNMLVRRWDNQPAGRLTWCALLLGGAASLAANVAAAEPTVIGRLVAAWPPICLIVSYELLMEQLPTNGGGEHR